MTEPVKILQAPVRLEYTVSAGRHLSRYLRALAERRIIAARCGRCKKAYVPPRGVVSDLRRADRGTKVAVQDRGTLTTFCIINIPFENAAFPPPYAAGAILLDGADIPIFHLIRGLDVAEVRMGLRVRAVWVPDEELAPTLESISWFEPSGEPDAAFESFAGHV